MSVTAVNDGPDVSGTVTVSVAEDASITVTTADLLANASDVDGDALSVSNLTVNGNNASVFDNGNGTWTITPVANFNGALSLSYDVTDGTATVSANLDVSVTAVNDGPVISGPVTASVAEDTSITVTAAQLLANASDVDGDALSVINFKVNGGNATVIDNGDGIWTITPDANFNGDLSLTYDVSDGTVEVPTSLDVSVTAVNDGPVVSGSVIASIAEDTSITVTAAELLANASDIDGDDLSVSNLKVNGGNATVVDNLDGTWTITPDANFNGDLSLSYDVSDGTAVVSASLEVTVTPVNDGPVVSGSITATIAEDTFLTITSAQLLVNASDIDGDALSISNLTVNGGNATVAYDGDGIWTITPDADFNGDLSLSYDVTDGTAVAPGTLDVSVTPVDEVPVILTSYTSGGDNGIPDSEEFNILIEFEGTWTTALQDAFIWASDFLSDIIIGDIADINLFGEYIDDIKITAELAEIDGTGGILGQAGPTYIRTDGYLPITAIMTFDSADAEYYDSIELWDDIVIHEMLHSIGFGTVWSYLGLVTGEGTSTPTFNGTETMLAYSDIFGGTGEVPLEYGYGAGTDYSHWDDATFGNEIMTGFISGSNDMTALTIASLDDLGYETVAWQDFVEFTV